MMRGTQHERKLASPSHATAATSGSMRARRTEEDPMQIKKTTIALTLAAAFGIAPALAEHSAPGPRVRDRDGEPPLRPDLWQLECALRQCLCEECQSGGQLFRCRAPEPDELSGDGGGLEFRRRQRQFPRLA